MHPILLEWGALKIWAYGTMLALAFALGAFEAAREAPSHGIAEDHVYNLALVFAVAGVAGARGLHVLLNLSYYLANPWQVFDLRGGGLALHGGFALAILAGIWYTRWQRIDAWELADFLPKWGVLGIAIVRWGCLLNGCCFGIPTKVPWALGPFRPPPHPGRNTRCFLGKALPIGLLVPPDDSRSPPPRFQSPGPPGSSGSKSEPGRRPPYPPSRIRGRAPAPPSRRVGLPSPRRRSGRFARESPPRTPRP